MNRKTFISLCCLLGSFVGAMAQDYTATLDALIQQYYPHADHPGISLQILHTAKPERLYQRTVGLAELAKQEKILPQSNFRLASVSKQFTAYAIYLLQQEGKLSFADPLAKYFPTLKGKARKVQILDLLNHTSGLKDYEDEIPILQAEQLSDADVLQLIQPYSEAFAKQKYFKYSNTAYCLLSLIVEQCSQQSYAAFMHNRVFQALGMAHTQVKEANAVISSRAYGYHLSGGEFVFADQSITSATKGDGGVYSSAKDYGVWAAHIIQSYRQKEAYYQYLQQGSKVSPVITYALGWFMMKDQQGRTCLIHSGESTGFHNIVCIQPETGLIISLFSNRDDQQISPFFEGVLAALDIQPQGMEGKDLFQWLSAAYAHQIKQQQQ